MSALKTLRPRCAPGRSTSTSPRTTSTVFVSGTHDPHWSSLPGDRFQRQADIPHHAGLWLRDEGQSDQAFGTLLDCSCSPRCHAETEDLYDTLRLLFSVETLTAGSNNRPPRCANPAGFAGTGLRSPRRTRSSPIFGINRVHPFLCPRRRSRVFMSAKKTLNWYCRYVHGRPHSNAYKRVNDSRRSNTVLS